MLIKTSQFKDGIALVNSKMFNLMLFLITFVILNNLLIWIEINEFVIFFSSYFVIGILFKNNSWYDKKRVRVLNYIFVIIILLALQMVFLDGITSMIANISGYIIGGCIFCLKDELKEEILLYVTRTFGWILAVAIFFYLIYLVHPYPSVMTLKHPYGYFNHECYIFFILPSFHIIPRFSGPFIEPGHIAMFSCFILYANRFQFKKYKILYSFLLTILISLSLAGYVLLIVGYMFYRRVSFRTLFIAGLMGGMILLFVTKIWNDGKNPVNELIVLRLQYDDEKGIAGNNRDLHDTDQFFEKAMSSGLLITGMGLRKFMELNSLDIIGGAGYKIFILQYGFIGCFLVFCYYGIIAYNFKKNIFSLLFLALLMICFLQRAYPYWLAWLIPFVTAFNRFNFESSIIRK